jgi:hypothetical protein
MNKPDNKGESKKELNAIEREIAKGKSKHAAQNEALKNVKGTKPAKI